MQEHKTIVITSLYSQKSKPLTNEDASGFNNHRRKLAKVQHMFLRKSFDTLKTEHIILIKVSTKSLAKIPYIK